MWQQRQARRQANFYRFFAEQNAKQKKSAGTGIAQSSQTQFCGGAAYGGAFLWQAFYNTAAAGYIVDYMHPAALAARADFARDFAAQAYFGMGCAAQGGLYDCLAAYLPSPLVHFIAAYTQ